MDNDVGEMDVTAVGMDVGPRHIGSSVRSRGRLPRSMTISRHDSGNIKMLTETVCRKFVKSLTATWKSAER
jgi:hypothetical protein